MTSTNKVCIVDICNNSSRATPEKIFFPVPGNHGRRKLWLEAMSCDGLHRGANIFVCEDHFDLQKDADRRYSDCKIRLKKKAIPFEREHGENTWKERNSEGTEIMDDEFSFFVKSIIAHLKQMPVQNRLRAKNKIENIMKRCYGMQYNV